ncbi:hypothetical protein CR513_14073, partial [Mucuna pruriens]
MEGNRKFDNLTRDNVYNHITSETHAGTLWEKIESLYVSKCGNNKLFLLNSIVNLKFKEGTSLSDHLNKFQGILDQMSRMGIKYLSLKITGEVKKRKKKRAEENTGKKGKSKEKDHDDRVTATTSDDLVILDSSTTLHVIPRKEFFTSYILGDNVEDGFIDDCSKKLWVYNLKSKDQVLEKFKQFQALVEKQSGKKMKCIRSDNGDEYCGPFDGIRHGKTHSKTPELNGLVERMNTTLIERVRYMRSKARLYDPVEKKLVRSRDLGDGFDISPYDDVKEEQEMSQDENLGDAFEPPLVQRRSKHIDVRNHWIHYALDVKLFELAKVYTDDNGVDTMTKAIARGKFEACCEIVGLTITFT